ncbi:cytochrome c [Oleiagrimonas sp. C23AA]|uniref:cytochrome c n=1 Tax=Oleiagrimonas sp. C23AA TaxID=2719047 RepID=UPI001421772F|nr:cytochrome c [Oleiagrimonas sp. C23AA]NII09630.1 cytochrome c [Oleiagrimonas sp. C23AA]
MRALLLVLLGLVVGAVGATMIGNALRLRDAYPRGVMVVMQHHLVATRKMLADPACKASKIQAQLARLDAVDSDIPSAFGADSGPLDPGFAKAAKHLQQAVTAARAVSAADCEAMAAAVSAIAQRCDDCHRQYR